MPYFDFPYEELLRYCPPRREADDFDAFWQTSLAEARAYPLEATFMRVDEGLQTVEAYDVTFRGYAGQPIKGWLLLPAVRHAPLPCVVEYIGYGGGRGFPLDWLDWSAVGYAHLVMDTRGQGSSWLNGDTPDFEPEGSSPHYPGFMTRGILSPHTYYYRRLIVDAVRAVEAVLAFPEIDPQRIAVTGHSQGGGLSIAVAGLHPGVAVSMPDAPFLCHYQRAVELVDTDPYVEITHYCQVHRDKVERVFQTLSYFDGVNFAARAHARAFFSVALMDETCPPSTVYAAYNHYAGPKQIEVYRFNQHEAGRTYQMRQQIKFLNQLFVETSHAPARPAPLPAAAQQAEIITVRPEAETMSRQHLPYYVGISAATAGAHGLSLNLIIIPPGGAAQPHLHRGYETAIYLIKGRVETRYGPGLSQSVINQSGDFLFIPPDVPHQPVNLSADEPAVAIVARNDPNEQEHVILV